MVCMAHIGSIQVQTSMHRDLTQLWVVDSGSEKHLSCRRDWFEDDFVSHPISIKAVGGGIISEQGGHGTIRIPCTAFGKKVTLHLSDVTYSPSCGVNLVSTGCITSKGIRVVMENDWVQFEKEKFRIRGRKVGSGLYFLDTIDQYENITTLVAHHISDDTTVEKWHKRMGHASENTLKKIAAQVDGMDLDAPKPKDHLCKGCVMAKCKNNPHKGHLKRATRVNEIIHTDVMGPWRVLGTGRARYVISFLDDFTGYSEVYFMEFKSESLNCFKKYYNANISKGPFGSVHSDNGGEYLQGELQSFFNQEGIVWETSCPYTPQQNGRAEKLGQDLQIKGTALRYEASSYGDIPEKFWPEFVRTANYLRNLQALSREGITAFQAHQGEKPDVSHLRIIGCNAYALNHEARKLDPRAIKCRLLGYEGNHIYRLLSPNGKVIRHSSVHFDERISDEPTTKRLRLHEECPERGDVEVVSSEPPSFDTSTPELLQPPDNTTRTSHSRVTTQSNSSYSASAQSMTRAGNQPSLQHGEKRVMVAPGIWETAIQVEDRAAIDIPNHLHNPHFRVNFQRCLLTTALLCKESDDLSEPQSYEDLMNPDNFPDDIREKYEGGMTDEFNSLNENHTWDLVPPPSGYQKKVLRGKWVYKIKRGANGEIIRYKARWVVRGFEQQEGIDYHETFASVVKPMSYKTLFALAAAKDLEIEQMDVKTAFLYGDIDEEIYVEQPPGFDDGTGRVCRLNKGLYGLKQAPRIWYTTLATFLKSTVYKHVQSRSLVLASGIKTLRGEKPSAIS
jgi:transposase InsO family protein